MSRIGQILKSFRWPQWLILICFLVASSFTVLIIYRTVRHARSWRHHRDEPIRGWMTVGYVAHTYHVSPNVLYEALGLEGDRFDKRPLREIAKDQHRSMEELRTVLEEVIIRSGSPYLSPSPSPSPSRSKSLLQPSKGAAP